MTRGGLSFLGLVNIGLALGLVFTSIWLYSREHETRQIERQIRSMKRALALEKETIRRLEIEWQRLRNPMRLERLARERLALQAPDPQAVMRQEQALELLPLRPPPMAEAGTDDIMGGADALAGLAAQAAAEQESGELQGARKTQTPANGAALPETSPPAPDDPLARLIGNGGQHGREGGQ